ncbi:hypothetical protein HG537_0A05380 [Torulaspora globosa]|uniref:DNA polymerase eta n=1 Tax=Torulaspora globosa TaxID=48254 RepID=A0A7H9HM66_9SACH|nr:hypothetical protein HG537_0A05380 [Torulaspora sp. CBS 2947]
MSQFKWKDLTKLKNPNLAFESPLSVLCHIDVNCFYAQVEAIRCGYTKDDPVVCVQWNSIVAVSYAARKYGISRMVTIQEALKKTDKLIPIHTAVFKKGEDFWQYHDGWGPWNPDKDKKLPSSDYKISLDPYRRESRKIFKIFTEYCDLAEKASVDEVFLDIARLCLQSLMGSEQLIPGRENPEIIKPMQAKFKDESYEGNEFLPAVPEELKQLPFIGDVYNPENLPLIEDWDDVLFALGSRIAQELRDEIKQSLGYTTSCGLASTKNVCKLASNFKKPDAQTIIKNSCVNAFLDNGKFEITTFWSLGGILGKELIQILQLPQQGSNRYVREKWPTRDSLRTSLSKAVRDSQSTPSTVIDATRTNEIADKLYDLVRGQYRVAVTPQTIVKSMMANKNMTGQACSGLADCFSWLEVFAGELAGRVHELEQEYDKVIRPRTIHVLIRAKSGDTHSKSGPFIQSGAKINSQDLLKAGAKLIAELDAKFARGKEHSFYPLININMSISNLDVADGRKSVLDMFGNQASVQVRQGKGNVGKDSLASNAHKPPRENWCDECNKTFETSRDFQEHADFHIAVALSEKVNGANGSSGRLTFGEKRLLMRSNTLETPNKRRSKPKSKTAGSSSDIFKYFKKG